MILIELFDKTPVNNIITTLAFKPDIVVFVGSDQRKIRRDLPLYEKVLAGRGINTEMQIKSVAKNNLDDIVTSLYEIISDPSETYIVDFSGGDESSLLAVGMILGDSNLKAQKICAFRVNSVSRRGLLFELVCEGSVRRIEKQIYDFSYKTQVYLTVEENIIIHGGRVFGRGIKFQREDEVSDDIDIIWDYCKRNTSEWNSMINKLSAAVSSYTEYDDLFLLSKDLIGKKKQVSGALWDYFVKHRLVIVDDKLSTSENIIFRYKNRIVYECLNKAGSALEYRIYKAAIETKRDGEYVFDDAEIGVIIGWNDDPDGTKNEIDVMLMRGTVPIFISCKNGDVDTDELYKLNTVSDQFSGDYSEKALFSTGFFDPQSKSYGGKRGVENIKNRADNMGVRLVSNIHHMSDKDLEKEILRLI